MAKKIPKSKTKAGFTLIEVSIFLAITGLLLIGVLGGTYSSIATQRYNDSLRSFAEFIRQLYGEVISPESIGQSEDNVSTGDSDVYAIYGKIAVFGLDTDQNAEAYSLDADDETRVYTATVVGSTALTIKGDGFLEELAQAEVSLYCGVENDDNSESSVGSYTPLWGAHLLTAENEDEEQKAGKPFYGTVLIARSPASGIVHTAYINEVFDIKEHCVDASDALASTKFKDTIKALAGAKDVPSIDDKIKFEMENPIGICVESDNSNIIREVQIASDGRNTSAVNILTEEDSKCPR